MRTESQNKRYRDGYAAGHRDGNVESGLEVESQRRSPTGDDDTDAGYSAGFDDHRQSTRAGQKHQSADLFRHLPWLPRVSAWLKRFTDRTK
jgi:hypothetical protein